MEEGRIVEKAVANYTVVIVDRLSSLLHAPSDVIWEADAWEVLDNGRLIVRRANGGTVEYASGQWSKVDGIAGAVIVEKYGFPRELTGEELAAMRATPDPIPETTSAQ